MADSDSPSRAVELFQLDGQCPKLAAARDQAGGGLLRPDRERAVGGQQLAGQGDEAESPARPCCRAAAMPGAVSSVSTIQVEPNSRRTSGGKLRLALDEPVGPLDDAGLGGQVGALSARPRSSPLSSSQTNPTRPENCFPGA